MEDHFDDFVNFYKKLGDDPRCWIKKEFVEENSINRTHTTLNHFDLKDPAQSKVCCCTLKEKQSEKKVKWVVVQQKWLQNDLNIHGEKHRIGRPKRVWEVCGSHLGSYSYFMYLNPTYELAFEGVAAEVGMDLGGDLISQSLSSLSGTLSGLPPTVDPESRFTEADVQAMLTPPVPPESEEKKVDPNNESKQLLEHAPVSENF